MDELVAKIVAATGADATVARRAAALILGFLLRDGATLWIILHLRFSLDSQQRPSTTTRAPRAWNWGVAMLVPLLPPAMTGTPCFSLTLALHGNLKGDMFRLRQTNRELAARLFAGVIPS